MAELRVIFSTETLMGILESAIESITQAALDTFQFEGPVSFLNNELGPYPLVYEPSPDYALVFLDGYPQSKNAYYFNGRNLWLNPAIITDTTMFSRLTISYKKKSTTAGPTQIQFFNPTPFANNGLGPYNLPELPDGVILMVFADGYPQGESAFYLVGKDLFLSPIAFPDTTIFTTLTVAGTYV